LFNNSNAHHPCAITTITTPANECSDSKQIGSTNKKTLNKQKMRERKAQDRFADFELMEAAIVHELSGLKDCKDKPLTDSLCTAASLPLQVASKADIMKGNENLSQILPAGLSQALLLESMLFTYQPTSKEIEEVDRCQKERNSTSSVTPMDMCRDSGTCMPR